MSHKNSQHIYGGNADYIEHLYGLYLSDPKQVGDSWRAYFQQLENSKDAQTRSEHSLVQQRMRSRKKPPSTVAAKTNKTSNKAQSKQTAVLRLIRAYRALGHRQASIDPLHAEGRTEIEMLNPEYHGLSTSDLDAEFYLGGRKGEGKRTLREILNMLSTTYCGSIGAELEHISDPTQKHWVRHHLESEYPTHDFSSVKKKRVLERLIAASALEMYLHRKYVGQKRFSLEGGTSLIPLLDALIQRSGEHGVKETIIGMAHRGRLNVLVNILGKNPRDLFEEFEDSVDPEFGSGDVKYHKGFSIDLKTRKRPVHTVLSFNPSHLEIIDPVVEGSVRARQERRNDKKRKQVIPVLVHGDAAFAGQGVVMETLNLSSTRGYTTGGTIHIVVNNQIGFTTSDPLDSRSTLYCTDVAKMVQAPILHVNGDDPEAVVFVTELALDYRMKFSSDVVIDLICYRRHGHSEADEPAVTQPLMYKRIRNKDHVEKIYFQHLLDDGVVAEDEFKNLEKEYIAKLVAGKPVCSEVATPTRSKYMVDFRPYLGTHWTQRVDTSIPPDLIGEINSVLTDIPDGFVVHRAVQKILDDRKLMASGNVEADWGFAEMLAYGSLLKDGYPIRLSGQDSVRGTFFHRHCALHHQETGEVYIPLRNLSPKQPQFLPINSLLSEEAVLGYEVGYATSEPNALVIWEAQFGDFANNAQVIIDQFLSSSEVKWQRFCGLVLFLPHGYDGQGPEHSSARMERYLQLCAEENMQVAAPTTPAQLFHLLRRQMLRPYRKPLVVFTPKSLLRHPRSSSPLGEFINGEYKLVLAESENIDPKSIRKVILCAGKVYYDLLEAKHTNRVNDIAIIRIEQLYPFPKEALKEMLAKYHHVPQVVWVQEEPRNQGAWFYMQSRRNLPACISPHQTLEYVGRDYSASPAAGYLHLHRKQQNRLVQEALEISDKKSGVELRSVS